MANLLFGMQPAVEGAPIEYDGPAPAGPKRELYGRWMTRDEFAVLALALANSPIQGEFLQSFRAEMESCAKHGPLGEF